MISIGAPGFQDCARLCDQREDRPWHGRHRPRFRVGPDRFGRERFDEREFDGFGAVEDRNGWTGDERRDHPAHLSQGDGEPGATAFRW